mgnify:CR=1 FL=1
MKILKLKNAIVFLLFIFLINELEAQNEVSTEETVITNRWHSKRVEKDLWIKLRKQAELNPMSLRANQLWYLKTKGFDFIPDYDWSNKEINWRLDKAKGNKILPTILQYGGLGPIILGILLVAADYSEIGFPIMGYGGAISLSGTIISINRRLRLKRYKREIKELRNSSL